jgi:ABC-type branched-subunit amino acid transport system ATPase component
LDEPAEGVRPSIRDEIVETLKAVRERTALSMILVGQNVDFIKSLPMELSCFKKRQVISETTNPSDRNVEQFDLV